MNWYQNKLTGEITNKPNINTETLKLFDNNKKNKCLEKRTRTNKVR